MALLLREAIGDSLRRARTSQSRTLREVSGSARVSLGYLSEVERGRKEASSELLAAICDALEVPLSQVFGDVSDALASGEREQVGPVAASSPPAVPGRSAESIVRGTRMVIVAPATVRVPAHAA
ncbi:MAG: helix-turn-helix domain-containing protein [Mycobacteriaceae bacterium]